MCDGESTRRTRRRPMGFFGPFNKWWSNFFLQHGRRPSKADIEAWRNENLGWRPELSVDDIVQHSKGRRDPVKNRLYFVEYRRKLKAAAKKPSAKTGQHRRGANAHAESETDYDDEEDGARFARKEDASPAHTPSLAPEAPPVEGGQQRWLADAGHGSQETAAEQALSARAVPQPATALPEPPCTHPGGLHLGPESMAALEPPPTGANSCEGRSRSTTYVLDPAPAADTSGASGWSAAMGTSQSLFVAVPALAPSCGSDPPSPAFATFIPVRRAHGPKALAVLRQQLAYSNICQAAVAQQLESFNGASNRCSGPEVGGCCAANAGGAPAMALVTELPAVAAACGATAAFGSANPTEGMSTSLDSRGSAALYGSGTAVDARDPAPTNHDFVKEALSVPLWSAGVSCWAADSHEKDPHPAAAPPCSAPVLAPVPQLTGEVASHGVLSLQSGLLPEDKFGPVFSAALHTGGGCAALGCGAVVGQLNEGVLLRVCSTSSISGMCGRRGSPGRLGHGAAPVLPPLRLAARGPVPPPAASSSLGRKRTCPDSGSDSDFLPGDGGRSGGSSPAASAADAACSSGGLLAPWTAVPPGKRSCPGPEMAPFVRIGQCQAQTQRPVVQDCARGPASGGAAVPPCASALVAGAVDAVCTPGFDHPSLLLGSLEVEADVLDADWLDSLLADPGSQQGEQQQDWDLMSQVVKADELVEQDRAYLTAWEQLVGGESVATDTFCFVGWQAR